jgi:hypothetical protein
MNPDRRGRMGLDPENPGQLLPNADGRAPGWPVFITKEPFAIAPIGIAYVCPARFARVPPGFRLTIVSAAVSKSCSCA